MGSDLAAISWFFDRPYETPAAALSRRTALGPQRGRSGCARKDAPGGAARDARGADMHEAAEMDKCGVAPSNLSETELLVGTIAAAVATAEKAVGLADRAETHFQICQ